MNQKNGFTLIECLIALSLFSIVLVLAMNLYLTCYRIYRRQEYQVDVEQNARVILNRISETLRRTDLSSEKLSLSDTVLYIGSTRYYLQNGIVHERIENGTNNLGERISRFIPCLENGYLTIRVETLPYREESPFSLEQVFYVGGE
ncbi:MAG: prepilin-type N-terminal cleavage/methylation domain-containing protein [Clostridia bacterium]|nr:prepilin-type N-terminal cleavage/methylation domain-containing protein [Clostridia bacterium]